MLTSVTIGPILKPKALQISPRLERLDALTRWSGFFVPTRKAFNNIALYGGTRSPAKIKQTYANATFIIHKWNVSITENFGIFQQTQSTTFMLKRNLWSSQNLCP